MSGGHVIPGMVCAWWFDGEDVQPLVRECRMASISDTHPLWPGEGKGRGRAVVPLTDEDMSMEWHQETNHSGSIFRVTRKPYPRGHLQNSKQN